MCAGRDGVVMDLHDRERRSGAGLSSAAGNFIVILHEDSTWAIYGHLKYRSVLVEKNQKVRAGQVIGLSGQSGKAAGPHLHFAVFTADWNGEHTIPTTFKTGEHETGALEEWAYYYAWHPGKKPFNAILACNIDEMELARERKKVVTGKTDIREEQIDDKVFIYCVNGTRKAQRVTVDLSARKNVIASRPLPYSLVVPAETELFLLSFSPEQSSHAAEYEAEYTYQPVASDEP